MARTPRAGFRVDPGLVDAARGELGLTDAPVSVVVRYALALAARVDPAKVARVPIGRRPRSRTEAEAA
jgi:hypothetical protein